jgi:hypothetical protein
MRLDHAGEPAGGERHHPDEQHADIDQPGVGKHAEPALQQRDQRRAEDRAVKDRGAADIRHQHDVCRQCAGNRVEGYNLIGYRIKPAGDPGEHA